VRLYYQAAKALNADQGADIPLADFKVVPYNSRYNLLYRDVTSGTDETGTYIEVQKNDGCLYIDKYYGRQTQLVVTVYDGSQPGKTPYPCFYANGTEFNGAADFVINFFDYVYASEAEEIVIPPHDILKNTQTVTLQSQWFDLSVVWTGSVSAMDSAVAALH
jgi:hypothetical protein